MCEYEYPILSHHGKGRAGPFLAQKSQRSYFTDSSLLSGLVSLDRLFEKQLKQVIPIWAYDSCVSTPVDQSLSGTIWAKSNFQDSV